MRTFSIASISKGRKRSHLVAFPSVILRNQLIDLDVVVRGDIRSNFPIVEVRNSRVSFSVNVVSISDFPVQTVM